MTRLPGLAARRRQFEDDGIEPIHHEHDDEDGARAEMPARAKHSRKPQQDGRTYDGVDHERRASHGEPGGPNCNGDAFGRLRRDDGIDRRVQARTTMVSAI